MSSTPEKATKLRLRVRYENRAWVAVLLDTFGNVVDKSPPGNEEDAEHYIATYRKYRAWRPS